MRQIWIPKAGPPEVLEVREAPDPLPKPGEVRIRVEAAGINFADIMGRMGLYPDLPKMPVVVGYEVGGRIDTVGEGVPPDWVGRDVFAMTRFGGYSDTICVPEIQTFARPEGMSADEGAAIPVNYLTAFQLMHVMGSLRSGDTMLVHSAGGGVGIAATQLATRIGAKVIGTASQGKHDFLKSIGVSSCIDYRTEDFESRVKEITHGRGVELILDAVGGKSLQKGYRVLSPTGRIGIFGMSSAAPGKSRRIFAALKAVRGTMSFRPKPIQLMDENKGVFGVNVGHLWEEQDRVSSWMDELVTFYRAGEIRPVIAAKFSFDEAAAAHHYIQDRRNTGKVLLVP